MPLTRTHSPFTPRSRGPPTQHHYANAYNSYNPNILANVFHDNRHPSSRVANMYTFTSPHRNIVPNLTPLRAREPQQQIPDHPPLPPVGLDMHIPAAQTRANKQKASTIPGPKPHAKRPRVPASLDTGPIAAGCGVGPPVSDDGPVSAATSSPVLPAAGSSVPIPGPSSSTSLPTASYASLSQNRRPTIKQNAATDCWYFVRAVESDVQPMDLPPTSDPPLMEKPRTSHVSCKLCQ